jgi:hypothetical protein
MSFSGFLSPNLLILSGLSSCFFEALTLERFIKINIERINIPPNIIVFQDIYLLLLSFIRRRRISKYSHIRVTIKENAPYHSIYFGIPSSAPSSIKSKSKTRLSAAIPTTKTEKTYTHKAIRMNEPYAISKKAHYETN